MQRTKIEIALISVPVQDFEMDPQMGSIIAQEVADSKDLIRKQLAWNSEKHRFVIRPS
jgi:hypothetical protein